MSNDVNSYPDISVTIFRKILKKIIFYILTIYKLIFMVYNNINFQRFYRKESKKMDKFNLLFGDLETKNETAKLLINELKKTVSILDGTHNAFFGKYDISLPKFGVLLILYDNSEKGVMLSYIGEKLLVSNANITGLIDRLEHQGLVSRIRNSDDRRKISAVLTEEGRKFTEMIAEKYREWYTRLFEVIHDEDRNKLIELLQKLQKRISAAGMTGDENHTV